MNDEGRQSLDEPVQSPPAAVVAEGLPERTE